MNISPLQKRPSVLYFEKTPVTFEYYSGKLNDLGIDVQPLDSKEVLRSRFDDESFQAVLMRNDTRNISGETGLHIARVIRPAGFKKPIIILADSGNLHLLEKQIPIAERESAGIQVFNPSEELYACLLYTLMRTIFPKETQGFRREDLITALGHELDEKGNIINEASFKDKTLKLAVSVMNKIERNQESYGELLQLLNKWQIGKEGNHLQGKER